MGRLIVSMNLSLDGDVRRFEQGTLALRYASNVVSEVEGRS